MYCAGPLTFYYFENRQKIMEENFWAESRNLGLLPKSSDGLHGFSLNQHFASVSFSHTETVEISHGIIQSAPVVGFSFKPVSSYCGCNTGSITFCFTS